MRIELHLLFLGVFLLSGCVKEINSPVDFSDRRVNLHISAAYPETEEETKISLVEGSKPYIKWNGDEHAVIIFGKEGTNNSNNPTIPSVSPGYFSGKISIPSGFDVNDIKGMAIPADKADFRGSHANDKSRIRMYLDSFQVQEKENVFNPEYSLFFTAISSSELAPDGNGGNKVGKQLKSATDLIRFNVFGRHPAQRSTEVLKSIRIETDDRITGTAEWNLKTQPTTLNSNGDPHATVSLKESKSTIADKTQRDGIKLYMNVILGGTRYVKKVIVTTDKASYTKVLSKKFSKTDLDKFTVYNVGINLSNGYTREAIYTYPEDNKGWTEVAPEEAGFDSDKLKNITTYVSDTDLTGLAIIAGGEQIYSYGDLEFISYLASCRKSVLSMLYGKYIENGTINLNLTVRDMIEKYGMKEDVGGLLDSEKEATILDLITARSGVYHEASNSGDAEVKPARGTYKHGEHYLYNNWDFNFAGAVFERLVKGSYSGKEIYTIVQDDLALPIGMADWKLSNQRYGGTWQKSSGKEPPSYYPAYHLYLSTRDMARIGYLMLRKGQWKGKRLVSEEWIKTTTSTVSTFAEVNPDGSGYYTYGYMWWIFDQSYYKTRPWLEGAYTASGSGGQFITIIPKLDVVIAWKTSTANDHSTSASNLRSVITKLADAYKGDL